jgi:hypothetical protein
MCARIRKKHSVTVIEEWGSEAAYAFAVIGDSVQQEYVAAGGVLRAHIPGV